MSSGSPRLGWCQPVHTTQTSLARQIDSRHDARGGRHQGTLSFSKAATDSESQRDLSLVSVPSLSTSSMEASTSHRTPECPSYDDTHRSSFSSSRVSDPQGGSSAVSQHSQPSQPVPVSEGRQLSIEEAIAGHQATPRPLSVSRSPAGQGSPVKQRVAGRSESPVETSKTAAKGMERLRSKSIGSLSRESRIAALSVHLRTRLSYAAAKIEKSRHTPRAQDLPPTTRIDSVMRFGPLANLGQADAVQSGRIDSPASTTVSSPDMHGTGGFGHVGTARLSPAAWSEAASPHFDSRRHPWQHHHHQYHHHDSQMDRSPRPKLAPPVDIIPKGGSTSRRRRPNPNEFIPPSSSHRRHHSHQDLGLSQSQAHSDRVLVPGTPPLRPSGSMASTRHGGLSSSQSSTMEQDAIETLLFMSSPGHSGYSSHRAVPRSSNGSQGSSLRVPWSQPEPPGSTRGQSVGLEAQAGDEIDRMLDQMDSDSERSAR
ncbi:uncharacterized protein BP01DRAFT_378781 [Aspergillus saccharolyticus JOP 1030-1]|uniref:Uncharacterized protein n=1 Tax=Aspergillus saccharolyticus JOP 1030-1 TaxID=1450539 RepID=A0A318ZQ99_9EURO|nr:hypothetical protein BP01DRAFT_378781 [Aspergillus saccharolyticus JOP 1030-1]PYH49217.1 hypothetical protein BP01DRAFT_378781 [Aspergillus saccharolyticus JOP 1030-1]